MITEREKEILGFACEGEQAGCPECSATCEAIRKSRAYEQALNRLLARVRT